MTESASSLTSRRAVATVRDFLGALEQLDNDRATAYLARDVVYRNVSLPAAKGIGATARQLRMFARVCTGFEVRIHHIAADGGTVLTERTDVVEIGPWRAEFWVCGTFQVENGLIVAWTDYFDWANLIAAGVRGVGRAVATTVTRRFGRGG